MKFKYLLSAALISSVFFITSSKVTAQAFVDFESGGVFTGYNNVRIPGDGGTKFSLKNDLSPTPSAFLRLRAGYTIKSRHAISLLYAPLSVGSSGAINRPIDFEGVTFGSNTLLDASYVFNSYRVTYRYDFVKRPKFEFGAGFTAKIRDAEIALRSETLSASKTNVGFVPIINFRLNWQINDKIGVLFEGDALAAPQGRAEDVLLAGTYKVSDELSVRLGYRILEGGADNDEVYNFSLFHYATFGVCYTFKNKSFKKGN
ncbi:hypothetical protein MM236_10640 [Belliella sp. DSM 107340]|uniref:Outer membrane protein beta-barrel domain-containing protein n=1 Tax=Belliella calami TaxID=2923436 RepID=A0ABS9UP95_9BACT|nr:hypothetical protein [Belliella calami]MCH7398450.1 hypothetical protein [Belliella calami]